MAESDRPRHKHGTLVHEHGGADKKHRHRFADGGVTEIGHAFPWKCSWPECAHFGTDLEEFREHQAWHDAHALPKKSAPKRRKAKAPSA